MLDWERANITTIEEVIAYIHLLMWNNQQWRETFLSEAAELIELNDQWLSMMQLKVALAQLVFWTDGEEDNIGLARQAMIGAFVEALNTFNRP